MIGPLGLFPGNKGFFLSVNQSQLPRQLILALGGLSIDVIM